MVNKTGLTMLTHNKYGNSSSSDHANEIVDEYYLGLHSLDSKYQNKC